jgi:hypothetical protein
MKVLGAWIIAYGIFSLALGLLGLQFRILFFMDMFGPNIAYVIKFAFIALGVWIWRHDNSPAVEKDVTEEESRRAWIPVLVAATVVVGIIVFITVSAVKNSRLERQLTQPPPTPAWAAQPVNLWPTFVLMQKAEFEHHTTMEAGCACLVRLPTGEIVALTAGHLLGRAGGVRPGFIRGGLGGLDKKKLATLDTEITSWNLFLPTDENESIKVAGIYGDAGNWDEDCDQVLLRLAPGKTNYPATPLDLRLTPVPMTERLRVVTYLRDKDDNVRQVIHDARRVPGATMFTCVLDKPAELDGFSGAPVLDKDGLLVGIVTGGSLMNMSISTGQVPAFSGHLAIELMPVIKAAVASKGVVALTAMKSVSKIPFATEDDARQKQVKDPI